MVPPLVASGNSTAARPDAFAANDGSAPPVAPVITVCAADHGPVAPAWLKRTLTGVDAVVPIVPGPPVAQRASRPPSVVTNVCRLLRSVVSTCVSTAGAKPPWPLPRATPMEPGPGALSGPTDQVTTGWWLPSKPTSRFRTSSVAG